MKLQLMKCPLCGDTLLPTRRGSGLYAHEYQTACAFVCEELSEIQIEVLRDAALGRAVRRLPKDRGISHSSGLDAPEGWHVWGITRVIGSGVSPEAALEAAGLMEVEKRNETV